MALPYTEISWDGSPILTGCQRACPAETDASMYVALIAQGRFREALAVVREENPFPGICGRVCDHQCEIYCRRGESDGPVAIRLLKRFVADRDRAGKPAWPRQLTPRRPERVAVIGSGPAGLTAAADLLRAGYGVSVFEKLPAAGGMMRVGIPDYRLPLAVLEYDLEYLRRMGVPIILNAALGRDFTLGDLKSQGYRAVVLATGAHGSRPLTLFREGSPPEPVDEAAFPGLLSGIEFLRQVKLGQRPALPARVVVIGGGDVAMDTARTALRLGAEQVDLVCLEPREQMPAHDWETREALDESIRFHCGWGPADLTRANGGLRLQFAACTSVFDADGRFSPAIDHSVTTTIEAGAVLTSIGQYAEFAHGPDDGIQVRPGRLYAADPVTLQTTAGWVFATGDAVYGTASVIKAVASGHRAATSVQEYLEGRPLSGCRDVAIHRRRVERMDPPSGWEELRPAEDPERSPEARVGSFDEVHLGLAEAAAVAEAQRCMRCDAETKSYTYTRAHRERISHLARDIGRDEAAVLANLQAKLKEGWKRRPRRRRASFDDLVFLPANLTRLVIDPYREECRTRTIIGARAGRPLELVAPVIIGGFAIGEMPEEVRGIFARGAALAGAGLRIPASVAALGDGVRVIGVVPLDAATVPLSGVSAVELEPDDAAAPLDAADLKRALDSHRAASPGVPVGVTVGPECVGPNVRAAVDAGADFATLVAVPRRALAHGVWAFDEGAAPRIDVLSEAIESLRQANREEDLDLVYFGGVRSGADVARALSLGATAVMVGTAACIAAQAGLPPALAGGPARPDEDEGAGRIARFVSAITMEAAILARCCGKTDVHNLEPEDLRSLTIETSAATGAPVAGRDRVFRQAPASGGR